MNPHNTWKRRFQGGVQMYLRGRSLVVKPQPSKLMMRVRFPPPALFLSPELSEPKGVGILTRHHHHQASGFERHAVGAPGFQRLGKILPGW